MRTHLLEKRPERAFELVTADVFAALIALLIEALIIRITFVAAFGPIAR